ncbi:MAG TPA: SUMF1/EgtB/PvdO family nonheme iron enzyme [Anaerolineales bacterium]|nr:SUMF1/EgtB/PvdO family nonheme iron enzyme [Anaerolineales bacterium]
MDKSVHKKLSPKEKKRLRLLQEELEGQELTALLERLQKQCELSANQMAIAAGMDESAYHKILKGDNREFKAEHVDNLLDELERQGKLANPSEKKIWHRSLRITASLHFVFYKAIEPRIREIQDVGQRIEALKSYLKKQYPALAETYDETGGTFPVFVPFFDALAQELHKRWGWIRVPPGYNLGQVGKNHYTLISTDLFPKSIGNLGSEVEVEDTGFGTFTVRRRLLSETTKPTPTRSGSRFRRIGGLDFVLVPAGKFLMGSREDNKLAWSDEHPQHTVNIPYDYWIGQFTVTNEQYDLFVQFQNGEHPVSDWKKKKNHPVVRVSWDDAQAYCKWLNDTHGNELPLGFVFRLPTEAEWEKAARGEFGFEWPWGNEFDENKCNSREGGKGGTTPVGAYSPAGDSPYGAADMAGNVWEWTQSLFKGYPYQAGDGREDLKASGRRVLRGGSFAGNHGGARCAYRLDNPILNLGGRGGFRVVASPALS